METIPRLRTPGPWKESPYCHDTFIVGPAPESIGGGDQVICEIRKYVSDPYEWMGNARLISSAPDGYELAKRIIAFWDSDVSITGKARDFLQSSVDMARAIVTKVEGAK